MCSRVLGPAMPPPSHVARCAFELVGVGGLDRVDEHDAGPQRTRVIGDRLEPRFAQHVHRAGGDREPLGPQPDLIGRLFPGHVQRGHARLLEPRRALQQQGGLPDARFAAHEHHRSRYDAAAEDEVEFSETGLPPLEPCRSHGGQPDGRTAGRDGVLSVGPSARASYRLFDECIPRAARLAASAPLGLLRAAVGTAEHRGTLNHARPRGATRAACSCQSGCIPS